MKEDKHSHKKANVKQNYITRLDVTLRDLSKEFDVPLGTLGEWASKEDWAEQRERFQAKVQDESLKNIAPKLAKDREKMLLDIDEILMSSVEMLKEKVVVDKKSLSVSEISVLSKLHELLKGNATSREERTINVNIPVSQMSLEQVEQAKAISNVKYEEIE